MNPISRLRASGCLSFWAQVGSYTPVLQQTLASAAGLSLEVIRGTVDNDSFRRPSDGFQRMLALMDKVITRGLPTWVDHLVEEGCRQTASNNGWLHGVVSDSSLASMETRLPDTRLDGDLTVGGMVPPALAWLWGGGTLDGAMAPGREDVESRLPEGSSSDEEWLFFNGLKAFLGDRLAAWVVPQPEFCEVLGEDPIELGPGRRPDFAFRLGDVRWVFEIDALLKASEGYALAEENHRRDTALRKGGWKVARITTEVCRMDLGAWLQRWWDGAEQPGGDALTTEERSLLERLRIPHPQGCLDPAWPLVVVPHLVQGTCVGLLQIVRWGVVAPGLPARLLVLAEEPGAFRMAVAQFLRIWDGLRNLDPSLPAPPQFSVDVVGGAETHDLDDLLDAGRVRYVDAPQGHYDATLSFAPSLLEGVKGCLEGSGDAGVSSVHIRWRRPLGAVGPSPLGRADLCFPMTPEEADSFWEDNPLPQEMVERRIQLEDCLCFFLRAIFRKKDFRAGQVQAIVRVLSGESTLVLLPTGSGKSLVYQLCAVLLPGLCLVVDPLVTLMADQVENLRVLGFDRVARVSSEQGILDKVQAQKELGRGLHSLVFISPHRMQIQAFRDALREYARAFPISLVVIDEVHCVSEWGHGFMTPYLQLGRGLREFARSINSDGTDVEPVFLGLTGTASYSVLTDVQIELGIQDERCIVLPRELDRSELRFEVRHSAGWPDQRMERLKEVRSGLPARFGQTFSSFYRLQGEKTHAGLIFCPHVNGRWGVCSVADSQKIPSYFGGKKPKTFHGSEQDWKAHKARVQDAFKRDEIQELVATKAFGMGIDKPNIRYTIHVVVPASIEAFYQEAGRAGRDREKAWCTILFDQDHPEKDKDIQDFFLNANFKDAGQEQEIANRLWRKELAQSLRDVDISFGSFVEIRVPFGFPDEEKERREKALCRLVWLGVVKDYLLDWQARQFVVTARKATPGEVADHLRSYFRRYKFDEEVERLATGIPTSSTAEAVSVALERLIGFAYAEIQEKRRQALQTMVDLCTDYRDEQAFRQGVLDYLEESKFSEELRERWLKGSWDELGESAVLKLLQSVPNRDEARRLLGSTRRLLDEAPFHVPLRVLAVLAAALVCERPRDEDQVITAARNLSRVLKRDELRGVADPCRVFLFVIEQADARCVEPFEDEPQEDGRYIPGLFSDLSKIFFQEWTEQEHWHAYIHRLRVLPYDIAQLIKAQMMLRSLQGLTSEFADKTIEYRGMK